METAYRHPVNRAHSGDAPFGARVADRVTAFLGSWAFILVQTAIVVVWIAGNVYLVFRFDPFPFILLNLAFSTQAAYAAPLILLASNRAAARDRLILEHAAEEADKEDQQNQRILALSAEILDASSTTLQRVETLEERMRALERSIGALSRNESPPGPR